MEMLCDLFDSYKNVSENLRKFRIVRRDLRHQILNTKPPYSKQCGVGKPGYKISANKPVGGGVGVKRRERIESLSLETFQESPTQAAKHLASL